MNFQDKEKSITDSKMEMIKAITKCMYEDIKKGDLNKEYAFIVSNHFIMEDKDKFAEMLSGAMTYFIQQFDVNDEYGEKEITINLCTSTNEVKIRWYEKKRDKKTLIQHNSNSWCNVCEGFKPFVNFKKCGQCLCERYCSRECQVADWKKHKKVCEIKN